MHDTDDTTRVCCFSPAAESAVMMMADVCVCVCVCSLHAALSPVVGRPWVTSEIT